MTSQEEKVKYHKVSLLVDQWFEFHAGETFDLDTICRHLQLFERDNRRLVSQKLWYETNETHRLEKNNRTYRFIDKSLDIIEWDKDGGEDQLPLDIKWPVGRDGTKFGFDGYAVISPGDVIVLAGVSNMGKTAFCLNFLWENMDKHKCFLMGNEYTKGKFRRRAKRMDWKQSKNPDGTGKFKLVRRHENWKDIIEPDMINIIDWISMGDNFYQIGKIIEGIQSKLNKGIVMIALQKGEGQDLGTGGRFSEELASLYLLVDKGRITVRKLKEYEEHNSNGECYGFDIINGGAAFNNIHKIVKCGVCKGSGFNRGGDCGSCNGTGWVDADTSKRYSEF